MKNFSGFFRRAMILQPEDSELTRRAEKRTAEDGLYYIQLPSNTCKVLIILHVLYFLYGMS